MRGPNFTPELGEAHSDAGYLLKLTRWALGKEQLVTKALSDLELDANHHAWACRARDQLLAVLARVGKECQELRSFYERLEQAFFDGIKLISSAHPDREETEALSHAATWWAEESRDVGESFKLVSRLLSSRELDVLIEVFCLCVIEVEFPL